MGRWSSGMTRASQARGRAFESRPVHHIYKVSNHTAMKEDLYAIRRKRTS